MKRRRTPRRKKLRTNIFQFSVLRLEERNLLAGDMMSAMTPDLANMVCTVEIVSEDPAPAENATTDLEFLTFSDSGNNVNFFRMAEGVNDPNNPVPSSDLAPMEPIAFGDDDSDESNPWGDPIAINPNEGIYFDDSGDPLNGGTSDDDPLGFSNPVDDGTLADTQIFTLVPPVDESPYSGDTPLADAEPNAGHPQPTPYDGPVRMSYEIVDDAPPV